MEENAAELVPENQIKEVFRKDVDAIPVCKIADVAVVGPEPPLLTVKVLEGLALVGTGPPGLVPGVLKAPTLVLTHIKSGTPYKFSVL